MFCKSCGASLEEHASFCSVCGAPVSNAAPASAAPSGAAVVLPQGVSAYYTKEFSYIAATGQAHFNPAAFFFGSFHMLYRGCTKRFLCLYLPAIVVTQIISFLTAAFLFRTPVYSTPGILLSWICSFVTLGISIYNGITFNKYYYHQQRGNPAVPAHTGRVYVLSGVLFLLFLLCFGLTAPALLNAVEWESNAYPTPDTQNQSGFFANEAIYYEGTVADWLSSNVEYDQSMTNGYLPAESDSTDAISRLNAAHLFYSDTCTLETLFSEACDTYQWVTPTAEDDDSTVAVCIVGDTVVEFSFMCTDTMLWIDHALCYLVDDDESTSFYTLNGAEICSILDGMLRNGGHTDDASLARDLRGSWMSNSTGILEIDAWNFSQNGAESYAYTLGDYADGTLWFWLDEADGDADDFFVQLSTDGNTLTILSESDTLAGTYARIQ